MTHEEYYGKAFQDLKETEKALLELINNIPAYETPDGVQPILYCKSRIKSPESMIKKLELHGLPTDSETAIEKMNDTIGIRIICSFVDDVYQVSQLLRSCGNLSVINQKDYMAYPKPNGYRSLHLIVGFSGGSKSRYRAEIQIRTIALDFWAALEHQLKYKRHIEHERIIREELKRCADEIASLDMSMQTLRDVLRSDKWL